MNDDAGRRWRGGETALAGLLLLLGILVLAGQALELDVGAVGWPFFVILPGLGLLGFGLARPGRLGEVLVTVGGVVTMAGVVLLVQNATDRFDTWAYAWTLVFVVGAGIGRWLVGVVRGRGDLVAGGAWLVGAGLVGLRGLGGVVRNRGRARRRAESGGQTAMTWWKSARPPRDLLAARGGRRERALAELEGGHRG